MLVPVFVELFLDIEILEVDLVGRTLELNVTAGPEVNFLAFRQLEHQLFDEGGDVVVGDNLAFPLLDAKELFRHFHLHVLFYRNLAGQAPALFLFTIGEVGLFRRQHGTAALQNLALALGAGTAATAGRGEENTTVCQSTEQLAAGFGLQRVFWIIVDLNGHITGAYQPGPGRKNHCDQGQNDNGEHDHAENNFCIHGLAFSLNRITG